MLKEVSKEEALNMYIKGTQNIQVLRFLKSSERYCMYDIEELFDKAKFLIDVSCMNENHKHTTENTISSYNEEFGEETIEDAINKVKELASANEDTTEIKYNSQGDVKLTTINYEAPPDSSMIIKPKGKRIHIDLGKLYALSDAGWSCSAIAKELNCSTPTVRKYVNDEKLKAQIMAHKNT